MSGYMFCIAPCLGCKRVFTFNPERVPSLGNEPICRECIDRANVVRAANGFPPHEVLPGAYDPAPEFDDGGDFD
jgi:hypothetical protein